MYERFFELTSRPFTTAPQPARFVPTTAAERARQTLINCLERAAGTALLIGPTGTGKTLTARVIAEQLRGSCAPLLLNAGQLTTRRALLQALLHGLSQPYRGLEDGELRLALADVLAHSDRCAGGLLLAIDDAQLLSLRLFEELRWLTGLQRQNQPAVRLLLTGAGALEETLAQPKLESLAQTIAARAYLEPLSAGETETYLRRQIELAGGDADRVFAPDAYRAVQAATDGIARLVNQVADHALLMAYVDGAKPLCAARIEQAWSDLQQMPAIWSGERRPAAADEQAGAPHVIEFGSLDESADESARCAADEPNLAAHSPVAERRFKLVDHDDYRPAGVEPEIELGFGGLALSDWDALAEEEIVVDHYAELDARRLPRAPRDSHADVQELSETLRAIEELQQIVDPLRAEPGDPPRFGPPTTGRPEIVIVEDEPAPRHAKAQAAKKVEYRQLFAKLRGSN